MSPEMPINPLPPSGPYGAPQPPHKKSVWRVLLGPFVWVWAHLGHFARVRLVVLVAIFVFGVGVAIIEGPRHTPKPLVFTTAPSSSSTSGNSFTSPSQLSVACGSHGQAIKDNDKYRSGKAPYHIAIFEQSEFYQTQHYDYSFPSDVITNPAVGPAVRPVAPSATQLVACIDRTSEASTGKSCPYQPLALPIYSATYQLTVYEAATHHVVLQTPVGSVPLYTARDNCPIEHEYDPKNPRIYYPVDDVGLATILKSLVQ